MWPLRAVELSAALASTAVPLTGRLEPEVESDVFRRAIAWPGLAPAKEDILFVIERGLGARVRPALAAGAICVVPEDWPELAALEAPLRARCFVARSPLGAYRRLAAYLRERFTFPVIAVGGSNGKTTTKELLASLLAAGGRHVTSTRGTDNGWAGTATTLCRPDHTAPGPDALVLEIGIDERGAMREHARLAAPDVAVLTALGPEHLTGLGTHEDAIREELDLFAEAKRRVWLEDEPALATRIDQAREGDLIVTSNAERAAPPAVDVVTYSWRRLSPASGELTVAWRGETIRAPLPLPGAHNGRNAALAIACALSLGRRLAEVGAALASVRAPPQRCVVRTLASGCILIDDCYNASPSSVDAALDVLEGFDPALTRLVVLGDMLELGEASDALHAALAPRLARLDGAHLRLFGDRASAIAPLVELVASEASGGADVRALASIGRAARDEDPTSLVDLPSLDRTVVLVKGSRGMSMERVVDRIVAIDAAASDTRALRVGIVGRDAPSVAVSVRARAGPATVRVLGLEDLAAGAAVSWPVDLAMVMPIDLDGADPERDLAAVAQLLVHLRPGGAAYLCEDGSEPDEVMALLADVLPPGIAARRGARPSLISAVISEIHARSRGKPAF